MRRLVNPRSDLGRRSAGSRPCRQARAFRTAQQIAGCGYSGCVRRASPRTSLGPVCRRLCTWPAGARPGGDVGFPACKNRSTPPRRAASSSSNLRRAGGVRARSHSPAHAGRASAARARGRTGGRPTSMTPTKLAPARQLYDSREHSLAEIWATPGGAMAALAQNNPIRAATQLQIALDMARRRTRRCTWRTGWTRSGRLLMWGASPGRGLHLMAPPKCCATISSIAGGESSASGWTRLRPHGPGARCRSRRRRPGRGPRPAVGGRR